MGKKCFVGKSTIEQLFDLIDEGGNGEIDKHEFFTHMGHLLNGDMEWQSSSRDLIQTEMGKSAVTNLYPTSPQVTHLIQVAKKMCTSGK